MEPKTRNSESKREILQSSESGNKLTVPEILKTRGKRLREFSCGVKAARNSQNVRFPENREQIRMESKSKSFDNNFWK